IKLAFLRDIEEDAFQLIPSETYVRGFIRSYAKMVHLNPEEILNLYRSQAVTTPGPVEESPAPSNRHLKLIKNHFFDFLTTMAGGTPAYSLGKSVFRHKD
ncbi:MAG: helix-turn-helix domain-containing protein, partial [Planctomycetaceae bacterium]